MENKIAGKALMQRLQSIDFRCELSGEKLVPETASVDHATPLSKGGAHDMSNVLIVSRAVNRAKGTMTKEEFVSMCCDVAKHVGSKAAQ